MRCLRVDCRRRIAGIVLGILMVGGSINAQTTVRTPAGLQPPSPQKEPAIATSIVTPEDFNAVMNRMAKDSKSHSSGFASAASCSMAAMIASAMAGPAQENGRRQP
jgi:hypothetical protein